MFSLILLFQILGFCFGLSVFWTGKFVKVLILTPNRSHSGSLCTLRNHLQCSWEIPHQLEEKRSYLNFLADKWFSTSWIQVSHLHVIWDDMQNLERKYENNNFNWKKKQERFLWFFFFFLQFTTFEYMNIHVERSIFTSNGWSIENYQINKRWINFF